MLVSAILWFAPYHVAAADTEFITVWRTTIANESITIPTHNESIYNYSVDWGDGSTSVETGNATHPYDNAGTYRVSITGDFPRINFNSAADNEKIISIEQWGDIAWSSMESAFEGCANLLYNATDTPDLSSVTSTVEMFREAAVFNGDIGRWDVSMVTDMSGMFFATDKFNRDISEWDVSQVNDMSSMFFAAIAFNQNLNAWNVGQVTDMSRMFFAAIVFNQNLNNWNVSSVTDMSSMFSNVTLSTENYDALLLGWSTIDADESDLQTDFDVNFHAGNNSKYCNQRAKDILINTYGWTVTDGGQDTDGNCLIPELANEIADQDILAGTEFSYTFPEDAFHSPRNDTLTYTVNQSPPAAWLNFNAGTRTFSGIPSADDIGMTITTTVTATDANGNSAEDTFTLTIVPNQPPVVENGLAPQTAIVGEPFEYSIPTDAFNDPDDGLLSYTATGQPGWLDFSTIDNTFSGTPTSTNDIGISMITVTVTDPNGGNLISTFTVTVPNRPPVVGTGLTPQTAMFGKLFEYPIPEGAFSDPDDGLLSYTATGQPGWLDFSTIDNTFSGTPTSTNDIGISMITVTVTDPNGGSLISTFTVTVPNQPPIVGNGLAPQTATVNETFEYQIPDGAFNDPDGGLLSYTTKGRPGWLNFSTINNTFSGTPTSTNDIGISTITVTVTDPNGGNLISTFTVTVPNRPPVVENGLAPQTAIVGEPFEYSIPTDAFSDPDGGLLSYTATGRPDWLNFSTETRIFFGTPGSTNDIGISMITVTVTDLNDGSLVSTFTLTVTNPFITIWRTTAADKSITIPTHSESTYNYSVNWGDSSTSDEWTGDATHLYADPGMYRVSITGDFPRIYFNGAGDNEKIISIEQWGNIAWSSMESAFEGCTNLRYNAVDRPNLSSVTSTARMFRNADVFNGDIGLWDVSMVTDMSGMFDSAASFDQDLNRWNVSKVTDMSGMFDSAIFFNQNLNLWDVSAVTDMSGMFSEADFFNGDIGNWDVSMVTDMSDMFDSAASFDQDLNRWNVSKVTDMSGMFDSATFFNQDLNLWNVSSVTDMSGMFLEAEEFNGDISGWKVGQVTDMSNMFLFATEFNSDISGWKVGQVTDMSSMFDSAESFNQNLNNWNVNSVTDMSGMFFLAFSFNQNLNNWNVSSVTDMSNMFYSADGFNGDISLWNVSQVTDMSGMFFAAFSFNQNLNLWNVSSVTDMSSMFFGATEFNGDISQWDVSQVTTMTDMFLDVTLSTENYDALLSGWSTIDDDESSLRSSVNFNAGSSRYCNRAARNILTETYSWMITDGSRDTAGNCLIPFVANEIADQDIFAGTEFSYTFPEDAFHSPRNDTLTYTVNVSPSAAWLNFSSEARIFSGTPPADNIGMTITITVTATDANGNSAKDTFTLTTVPSPFITIWRTSTDNESITIPTHSESIYNYTVNWGDSNTSVGQTGDATHRYTVAGDYRVSITGDFPRIFFNGVGDSRNKIISIEQWGNIAWNSMESAFAGCTNLGYNAADRPDLSNVTSTVEMFRNADIFNGDIGLWDVSAITDMTGMFDSAASFNQNLNGWDVSQVTNMRNMFLFAAEFNGDISDWNVGKVTDMSGMFVEAAEFNGDISRWDVSQVTNMSDMFLFATAFNSDISGWKGKVGQVTDMSGMFDSAESFNQNLSLWDVSQVTNMSNMFYEATEFNGDISQWDVSQVTNMNGMFVTAFSFNQNIGNWDIGQVTDMGLMFFGVTLSTENYDALLSGWSTIDSDESSLRSTVNFHAGNSQFCNIIAKNILENTPWKIADGGQADNCPRDTEAFITTWRTTTDNESITIPTHNESTYNYNVDWGDSNTSIGQTGDATHSYTIAGTYTVSITGNFPRIYFNGEGDSRNKIISIEQWGNIAWSSMEDAFEGCANLRYNAIDTPDLSNVTSTASMFRNAAVFNGDVGLWDVSQVADMKDMFFGVTLSTENYDALLVGWSTIDDDESSLRSSVNFHAGNSQFCNTIAKNVLVNTPNNWAITDDGRSDYCEGFITIWQTTAANESITIPTHSGSIYNYSVDWGDSNTSVGQTGDATHRYTVAGDYRVSITGDFPRIYFNGEGDSRNKIISIEQWGNIAWSSMESAFAGCTNLGYNAADMPDLSSVTSTASMFRNAEVFNGNIGLWDVSMVTDMAGMFDSAESFNQNLNGWNVSQVTDMSDMFLFAAEFNGDISEWKVGQVTDMSGMFVDATEFDGDISRWDVSQVTNMSDMFLFATAFNSDISGWKGKVGQVTDMSGMFDSAESFNQNLNDWDVSQVTDMSNMFLFATAFNGDISGWEVGQVTDMGGMFNTAESFNQNLSLWDVGQVTNMSNMFVNVTLSTENYDALLSGWSTIDDDELSLRSTVNFHAGSSRYCNRAARNILTNPPNNWIINDSPASDESCGRPYVMTAIPDLMVTVGTNFSYTFPEETFGNVSTTLTYTVNTLPTWLRFSSSTRTFFGIPTIDDIGVTSITITVTDDLDDTAADTFRLTIPNQPPIVAAGLVNQRAVINIPFSYSIDGAFNDPDRGTLSYQTKGRPGWLNFSTINNTFSGTPTSTNHIGISTIIVTVTDLNDGSLVSTFTLTVPNRLPIVGTGLAPQTAMFGKLFEYPILADAFNDPDDGLLSYTATGRPGWLNFSTETRTFSGTPTSTDHIGISTITVTVTDLNDGSLVSTFTVTVPNRPPIVMAGLAPQKATVNETFEYPIPEGAFSDPDDGLLSYTATGRPGWLDFSTINNTFSGTPTSTNDIGISTITVTVTDLNDGNLISTFTVTVPNQPPIVAAGLVNQSAVINTSFSYSIDGAFSDPDRGTLSYQTKGRPGWLNFSTETRTFSGTATSTTDIGISTITVTVADHLGATSTDNFTLNVVQVNTPTTLTMALENQTAYVGELFMYDIEDFFSDPDGGPLSYQTKGRPDWLSFTNEKFSGIPPNTDDVGINTVTITATDQFNSSASGTFTITVPNRLPIVGTGLAPQTAMFGKLFEYRITDSAFSDPDGGLLSYTTTGQPRWLDFSIINNTFSGIPISTTDIGISTITVTVIDLNDGSLVSTFTVTVPNRPPIVEEGLTPQEATVGNLFEYRIPDGAFSDPDDGLLSYTETGRPGWLDFSTINNTFSGTPTSTSHIGISTITVTVTDPNGGSLVSTFTVTVPNQPPTVKVRLTPQTATVGKLFEYRIPDNTFSDPDGGPLRYMTAERPSWLNFSTETRIFSGIPQTEHTGATETIIVTAIDSGNLSVSDFLDVSVISGNLILKIKVFLEGAQ